MSKDKISSEVKIETAKACVEGRMSKSDAARILEVDKSTVREWVARYKANGASAFQKQEHKTIYTEELKIKAVLEYLTGSASLNDVAAKYGLRTKKSLEEWIKCYNSGKGFRHKMSGGSHMSQRRKTTQEERITIAKDCLENGCNYEVTAKKYNFSYQQVYAWVKKYKELGESGLEDRRGQKIADQKPRSELEKAKIELANLKRELYLSQMELNLLKKANELERSDAFRK